MCHAPENVKYDCRLNSLFWMSFPDVMLENLKSVIEFTGNTVWLMPRKFANQGKIHEILYFITRI